MYKAANTRRMYKCMVLITHNIRQNLLPVLVILNLAPFSSRSLIFGNQNSFFKSNVVMSCDACLSIIFHLCSKVCLFDNKSIKYNINTNNNLGFYPKHTWCTLYCT